MTNVWTARAWVWAAGLAVIMSACGDDDGGSDDTVWTGLSGLVILVVIVWLVWRALRGRD